MNRRKIRKYRHARGNSGMKFIGFVGIMVIAIICGYLTARFVIAPLLGYDTEVLKLDFPSNLTEVFNQGAETADNQEANDDTEKKVKIKKPNDTKDEGFALQFGVFASENRAEELATKLEHDGIETEIKETGDKYKVISPVVSSKNIAVKKLKALDTDQVADVFITVVK